MRNSTVVFVGQYDSCVGDGSFALPEEWAQLLGDERCVCVVPDNSDGVTCINIVPGNLMKAEPECERITVDSRGRLNIDATLLGAAGIADKVKLVGSVRMIKAFSPEMFARFGEKLESVDSALVSIIDGIFDKHTESSDYPESTRQTEEVRKRIDDLEDALATRPKDVSVLTELMRLYRDVGEEMKRDSIMRRLRDIPSRDDIRALAKDFVATVDRFADGTRVEIDKLREQYAPLFEVVESRQEIRPTDIMTATGCRCSFAVDILKAFARLGMVSKDLSLGLRKVFDSRAIKWTIVHGDEIQSDVPPQIMEHYEEAMRTVRSTGECKISTIMRNTGLGFNAAALLADLISSQ